MHLTSKVLHLEEKSIKCQKEGGIDEALRGSILLSGEHPVLTTAEQTAAVKLSAVFSTEENTALPRVNPLTKQQTASLLV